MASGLAFSLGSLVALLVLRPLSAVHSVKANTFAATADTGRKIAAWQRMGIESTKHVDLGTYTGPTNITGIVTHAGHHALDYIDSATMLGIVLQRYLPEVPRFAIVIEGMKDYYQDQLKNAGWHLIMVEDWGAEHIGGAGNSKFLGRWGDSFEKLNVWRFPLDRVLFLDSDTYVFSNKVRQILDTKLEPGQIAMTKDGCKPEHNSGMMLFKPELSVYDDLLRMISLEKGGGREILDQTLVNRRYEGKIVTMDSTFNCIDYQVDPRCKLSCGQDTVIAHFTGNPKPTREGVPHVNLVRHGNISVCLGNNLGGCQLWSRYYCDMKKNTNYLSKLLRRTLSVTGRCLSDVALAEEEAEAKAKQEEAERKAKEEAEAKARQEEADRKAKEEAEAKAKEEAEAKAKEAAEAKVKEEAEAKARQEEAERKAKEDAEAKAREEAEEKARQGEAERKAKDEAEMKTRQEEAERKAKEEAEAKARQEEAERKAKEETDRKAVEEAEHVSSTRSPPKRSLVALVDAGGPAIKMKQLQDAISALPQIPEVALARKELQKELDNTIKTQLEDSISVLPDIPEVASARRKLQEQLENVNARIRLNVVA